MTTETKNPIREDGAFRFLRVVHKNNLRLHGNLLRGDNLPLADEDEDKPARLTQQVAAERAKVSRPSVALYAKEMRSTVLRDDALAIRADSGFAIGVDFGRTHRTRVALSNVNGKIVKVLPGEGGVEHLDTETPDEALAAARDAIQALLREYELTDREPIGVGISLPGPVKDGRLIGRDAKLWRDRIPQDELQAMLGWGGVPFATQSDTYLSALAEGLWGDDPMAENFLFVKWSAGLRAAIVIQGEPYTGHSGTAGELPHIVADESRRERCKICGQHGCLHAIAPLPVISARIAEREGSHGNLLRASQVIERVRVSSETMEELETSAEAIGKAIAPMIEALDPEVVILGGALGTRAYPLVSDAFKLAVKNSTPRTDVPLRGGQLEHRTAVCGAVALALEKFAPAYLRRAAGV